MGFWGIQLEPPVLRDLDSFAVLIFLQSVTLGVGVLDELLHVLVLQRVEHVPEVLALRQPAVDLRVRQVQHEGRVLLHERPELLHRELVVPWHLDGVHFRLVQEPLLLRKYGLQEVLVDSVGRRQIVLNC